MKAIAEAARRGRLGWILLGAFLASVLPAAAQFQLQDGYRNRFSAQGAPVVTPSDDPSIPGTANPLYDAYRAQWRNGTALGGFVTTRILSGSTVVAGPVSNVPNATTSLVLPSGGGVRLARITMARPLAAVSVSYGLGAVIPPPVGPLGQTDFYQAEPANQTVGGVHNDDFYWSPHARKVYATQPGVIEIVWVERGTGLLHPTSYAISSAPAKPERKIYWTEKGFNGPKVEVPASRVSAVNFIYNSLVPATVPDAFVSPYETPPNPALQQPAEKRTVWYEPLDQRIHAYNREGRVFLEYLGNLNADGVTREQLGFEIVNIVKEARPVTLTVNIGETVGPPPDLPLTGGGLGPDPDLTYSVVAGAGLTTDPFIYEHLSLGGSKKTLYAVRQTAPGVYVNGVLQQSGNEVLIFWQEAGERGIYWPKYYAGYIFEWPAEDSAYSLYARSNQAEGDAQATGVVLDATNNPALVYQDDPGKQQAVLGPGNLFYTNVGTDPEGRALLRYTNGEDIWFERVLSRLDTSFASFATPIPTDIGTRITPPNGSDSLIGYIRQPTGTAFDVGAYIDPFLAGFDEAAKGAIIGVNALSGKNRLEVWWYKKSSPPGDKLKPTYWPSFVSVHTLRWPVSPSEIVMAGNAGSGALPSLQATGSIYYQNDSTKPGYNPNEEHALMLNGRAWALRDDLNLATSSPPYVLLSYTANDGRPDMRVFKVLRENATWKFRYNATAGKILQAPMPLPVLPAPLKSDGSLASYEFQPAAADVPAGFDMDRDAEFLRYRRFTWIDRKGAVWILRGPHAGNPANPDDAPTLRMRYFYKTLPGFHYPGQSSQPAVGTLTPYLRPLVTPGNPAAGYIGNAVSGEVSGETLPHPQDIVFVPSWPAVAPELRVGETLTTAKLGLPAVRGQTSAQILYEQSIATDPASSQPMAARLRSARLIDPTRAKTFTLGGSGLFAIPASVKTSNYLGKLYFPLLPPHLSQRLYFDPAAGGPQGQLSLIGVFKDEPVGEKYLQLNVLGAADLAALKDLCDAQDENKSLWDGAIDSLSTTVETFKEDPAKRGTYIVDTTGAGFTEPDEFGLIHPRAGTDTLPDRRPQSYGPGEIAEIHFSDSAVDSYALSASGGGSGFVVIAAGNGEAFTPEGEPVSLHVIKVTAPLYRGELKVIASANPLDEKLTFQHSGDFAGHPEEYDFEWRYAPPVDGVPPVLFTVDRALLLGDTTSAPSTQWLRFDDPGESFADLRAPDADLSAGIATALPGPVVINTPPSSALPATVFRRTFTRTIDPLRLFASLDIAAHCGAVLCLNGTPVVTWNVPGHANSATGTTPGGAFSPLSNVFELSPSALVDGVNVVTLELYSDADPGSTLFANARLEATLETEHINSWLAISPGPFDTPPGETSGSVTGKMRHVVEGSSILTLTDNYFIVRYRAKNATNAAWQSVASGGGWSRWTNPQLGEGWIKRVLAGINPFQQRVTDLFNNAVNTDSSMLAQAGKRWEGDIALNLENINSFGLIEIYETVLRRGKMLSIDGVPPINYDGANDALLLAAGYLNDLYMLLGNEAYADSANPTIAYSEVFSGGNSGSVATSLFSFKGQLPTVLDEELALLRGRDDLLQPGTRTAPAYNRLFWNYTRGIDSGEAIYALNYNIRDMDLDGAISAADATQLYPQGHGDAYGHYLTALTNYYSLLNNPYFSWVPRTEAVLVLGQPVQVDYTDERKFAAAAAALARTSGQITDLTYRQQYSASADSGWSQLKDTTSNNRTGVARHWGTDEWASRGGQGAYFHWITANSLLPAIDDDPSHQGIRKIDRTTVPELAELAAQAAGIQQTLDHADARLNPLGLTPGAMQFDLDPTFLDVGSTAQTGTAAIQGQTHYDQIYQRALAALKNAASAFANAEDSTRFLRSQEDSLAEQRAVIAEQEQSYTNQLIEIYGTPYTDDIGPGRTYPQGYTGPDLVHPMYVEITENLAGGGFTPIEESKYTIYTMLDPTVLYQIASDGGIENLDPTGEIPGATVPVVYVLDAINGQYRRPSAWTGRRTSPGRYQTAVSNELLARQNLFGALYDFDRLRTVIQRKITLSQSLLTAHKETLAKKTTNASTQTAMRALELALNTLVEASDKSEDLIAKIADAVATAPPTNVGTSNDATSGIRSAIKSAATSVKSALMSNSLAAGATLKASELARESMDQFLEIDIDEINWTHENNQLLSDLRQSLQDYINSSGTVDATMRNYDQAQRDLFAVQAEGDRLQKQRLVFRQRAAALIQGYRTRDFAFRAFRNEALEKYKTLFDLASKYTYLTASSYDYETGLLDANGSSAARSFLEQIVKARAVGTVIDNVPQIGGSATGDPGLAGVLARMNGDWSVVKTRFGLNNPDPSLTTMSLRAENYRIANGAAGDLAWRDVLGEAKKRDIMEDPDVRRYCMQAADPNGQEVPGFILEFSSTITDGRNFFNRPLAGGDHTFTPTAFATKVRSTGIAFKGYVGMESQSTTETAVGDAGGVSPSDPSTAFSDPKSLSATPYVYLIPAGTDFMRSPPLGDSSLVRAWQVADQAIPLPFNIGGTNYANDPFFVSGNSLSETVATIRKHQAFRAVPDGTDFPSSRTYTNSRLIGRSAWNSRWKLVIPGRTLLANPEQGLQVFLETVKDIKLHLETYSYSGN